MKFSYEDLLSGDVISVQDIGSFRSPYLKELMPTSGIGYSNYNLYINIISLDKEQLIEFISKTKRKGYKSIEKFRDKIKVFDIISILPEMRMLTQKALAFFLVEEIFWNEKENIFETFRGDKKIGVIDRNNFEEVQDMVLQMNYINIGDSAKPTKHSSKRSKKLWERAQQYLKKESKKNEPDKKTSLANIISKLCAANTGYTLLNIYELTIFQLYDQFFQYGYLRFSGLNEMVYSNHGGDKFDIQNWLNPILKT